MIMKNILLALLLIFSCSCKEKAVNQQLTEKLGARKKVVQTKVPDSIAEKSIFLTKTKEGYFRIFVQSNKFEGKYFYSDTVNILKAENFVLENDRLKTVKSATLYSDHWDYLHIDSANIYTKMPFLFISATSEFQGTAVPGTNVFFWMVNTENVSENYKLLYSGYTSPVCKGCIKGDFEENKSLKNNPKIRNALYEFAGKSKLIFHPSKSEKSTANYKNFEEKWAADNHAETHWGAGYEGEMDEVISTYYKENLFEISGGTETRIENERYVIASYFRGNLIGYDKMKQRYFPIIVESCADFCNKEVEFVNDHTIRITYEDGNPWNLDLSKIKFD